jgi:hypothetical protein
MRVAAVALLLLVPVLFAGCTPVEAPVAQLAAGTVSLRTGGNLAFAASRARSYCGDPNRTPGVLAVIGEGRDQVATFGCTSEPDNRRRFG